MGRVGVLTRRPCRGYGLCDALTLSGAGFRQNLCTLLHVEPASACAHVDAPDREDVVAEVANVIERKVKALEALPYIREPLAHSRAPSVRLAGKAPKPRKQFDVRCGGIEKEVVVAFVPTRESFAHDLNVLLRHRAPSIPRGRLRCQRRGAEDRAT